MRSRKLGRNVRAILLAGGKGTRLAPYTTVLPKPLMPLGDMPIAEVIVRQFRRIGIQDVTFCVGYLSSLIQAYFGNGERFGLKIWYSEETRPLGTAGPIGLVRELKDTFVVLNGDILTTLDFKAMVEFHREEKAIATVGVFSKKIKIDLGILELDSKGRIQKYIEKPTLTYPVSMGIYVFEPDVLEYVPKKRHLDLPDLIRSLIKKGLPVQTFFCKGIWLDIGRKEDYDNALQVFERNRKQFHVD